MTKTKFKNVEDCLNSLPDNERVVTQYLRDIILENIPNCREKLSYNVPFYSLNKTLCFLWPGSIFWGNKRMYQGVRMGLTHGDQMSNELGYFQQENRKHVIMRDFSSTDDVDVDILKAYLFEAVEIDYSLVNKKLT